MTHLYRNNDITLYNEQSKEMELLVSEHQKMKMRVSEYERSLESSEAERLCVPSPPPTNYIPIDSPPLLQTKSQAHPNPRGESALRRAADGASSGGKHKASTDGLHPYPEYQHIQRHCS